MRDEEILELYRERSEDAIRETDIKYGKLCRMISMRILNDQRDSEEAVADTWMTLWETIPPKNPNPFRAYICRVAKNLSLKKLEYNHAKKRKSNYEVALQELAECIDTRGSVEDKLLEKELTETIQCFLGSLSKDKRILFLRRYWLLDTVKDIAKDQHLTEKTVSMRLLRLRKQLREYLIQEGYVL